MVRRGALEAAAWGLPALLCGRLAGLGVRHFFPTQREVLPRLLSADVTLGDACICAPTGSGKTLTYVLPIVAALMGVGRRRLRALVLVPTRDLAHQVTDVFRAVAAGTRLRVCVASGETSFAGEQRDLRCALGSDGPSSDDHGADILVATPGRLVEHLDATPGFSLHALRFCVVDEADRLLAEAYQSWPGRLAEALAGAPAGQPGALRAEYERVGVVSVSGEQVRTARPPLRKLVCSATLTSNPRKLAALGLRAPTYFGPAAPAPTPSAMAAALMGANGGGSGPDGTEYALPSTLSQTYVVCSADDKPALLLHALREVEAVVEAASAAAAAQLAAASAKGRKGGRGAAAAAVPAPPAGLLAMVFTGTTATAHRVTRLLQLAGGLSRRVVEFSSSLSQLQRDAVTRAVAAGGVSVLVCSDVAARGLDFAALPAVVQYDVAPRARAYVHRAGRTARAGAPGHSLSLVTPEQMRFFRKLLKRVAPSSPVTREVVPAALVSAYAGSVATVLGELAAVLEREAGGGLAPLAAVPVVAGCSLPPMEVEEEGVAAAAVAF